MSGPLVLPLEHAAVMRRLEELRLQMSEANSKRRAIEKAAMEAAGWIKCCKCWPNLVNLKSGFCGCCYWDHIAGKKAFDDVDLDAEDAQRSPPRYQRTLPGSARP